MRRWSGVGLLLAHRLRRGPTVNQRWANDSSLLGSAHFARGSSPICFFQNKQSLSFTFT